jgi:ribonuclease HI
MKIEAWFDGCCEPKNPGGHAAYGALVKVDGEVKFSSGEYVGFGSGISNNVAEYAGVACVLREIAKYEGKAIIRGDSKLVINQLSRRWKIHGGMYVPYYKIALDLLKPIENRVKFEWVRRDFNSECDELSKQVLRDRGVTFRIQPEDSVGGATPVKSVHSERELELDEDFKRAIAK